MKGFSRFFQAVVLCVAAALSFTACDSGSSSGAPLPPVSTTHLSGTVAAGMPVAGIVNVKGANGVELSSAIATDGTYSIDVSSLTAPYMLYASGAVNGRSISMYSAAVETGTINITPVTDFILRYALAGADPATAYAAWDTTQVSASALAVAETTVQTQLEPVLTAAGVSTSANLLTDPFTANHAGLDFVLDSLSIEVSGTTATVTNLMTGSSYTDNVASPSGTSGLPAADQTATTAAISDEAGIDAVWQTIQNLYASSPTTTQVASVLGPLMAPDFLEDGQDKAARLSGWDQMPAGMTFTSAILKAIQPLPAGYTKAYEINVTVAFGGVSMTVQTNMVYNGTNWLWYGNQAWVGYRARPLAIMAVSSAGTASFSTAFEVGMEDPSLYAYNQGARSAIVTGPGLPAAGVVLTHTYPQTEFKIYNQMNDASTYVLNDDAAIQAIPDNAAYTISLYAEAAGAVSLANTPLASGTWVNAKRPLLNSELSAAKFPAIQSPASHALADANIPGPLTVSWTMPAGLMVDRAYLNYTGGGAFFNIAADVLQGETSAMLDTTGTSAPDANTMTTLFLSARDLYERQYRLTWEFQ